MARRTRWTMACALWLLAACAHETSDAPVRMDPQGARDVAREAPIAEPAPEPAVSAGAEHAEHKAVPKHPDLAAPAPVRMPATNTDPAEGRGSRLKAAKAQRHRKVEGALLESAERRVDAYPLRPGALMPAAPLPFDREGYNYIAESEFTHVRDQPLSTFSVDVDTASYSNVRRFLREGRLPPADAVRIEELVNYFDYDYPAPTGQEPFSIYAEVSECPWNPEHRLVHLGVQAKRIAQENVPPRNLVFLIDVSGSMESSNKLPLLRQGLSLLARDLRPEDRISIVVYAGASGLVLPATSGADKAKVLDALARLSAGGSTNGAAGIELAYREAERNFIRGGVNRVILATDGDFNVGPSSEGELVRIIEQKRKSGVFLTVLGFGTGNLQDSRMEQLADKGNGNYAYIDSLDEAHKVLVREAGATLVTVAKDVKLQVEFNPAHVASYRLIGYENRALAARDFDDDQKDAGEIGAGHSVTALYEIVPVGAQERAADSNVAPLRYQASENTAAAYQSGELLTLKVRYKAPHAETSQLLVHPLRDHERSLRDASSAFRFSAAVAAFGMLLRDSKHAGRATLPALRQLAESALGHDPHGDRRELLRLMQAAERLGLGG